MPLIERDDSLVVMIDAQPRSWGDALSVEDAAAARIAILRAAWLCATARALGVPAVLTAEDPERNGPTASEILVAVGPEAPVFTKPIFGLRACPDIMATIAATGRKTAVLAGFETSEPPGFWI